MEEEDHDENDVFQTYNSEEFILRNRYAQKADGSYYYPRDASGNEYMEQNLGWIENNGKTIYPLTSVGKPRYERVHGGKEVYRMVRGKWILGIGTDGKEYYAVDEEGNEYYPPDNTPARMADGITPYYAASSTKQTIFPKNEFGNEYYLGRIDFTKPPETLPDRYAKLKSGREIYPLRWTADDAEEQCLLRNVYAVDENNESYYPKDGYDNEYYRLPTHPVYDPAAAAVVVMNRYAVTNDQKIILPTFRNTFMIHPTISPVVKPENIIGKLIREKDVATDYLTHLTYDTLPISYKMYKYRHLQTDEIQLVVPKPSSSTLNLLGICMNTAASLPFYRRACFWFGILLITLLIKALAVWWWFFYRKPMNSSVSIPSDIKLDPSLP